VFGEETSVKLTTFKRRLEESIIEEQDVGSEKETNLDDETEVNEATPEKQEIKEESTYKEGHVDGDAASIKDEDVDNMKNQSSIPAKIKPAVLPRTKK